MQAHEYVSCLKDTYFHFPSPYIGTEQQIALLYLELDIFLPNLNILCEIKSPFVYVYMK